MAKTKARSSEARFKAIGILLLVVLGGGLLSVVPKMLIKKTNTKSPSELNAWHRERVEEGLAEVRQKLPLVSGNFRIDSANYVADIIQIHSTILNSQNAKINIPILKIFAKEDDFRRWCKLLLGPQEVVKLVMNDFYTEQGDYLSTVMTSKKDCIVSD